MFKVSAVASLLLVSGACSLIFQSTWFREFRLVFGSSTLASSAVLAVFMGGLGFGNVVLGRLADRNENSLRLYAQLEFAVSLFCAVTPFLVGLVSWLYVLLGGQEAMGPSVATLIRLLGSVLVIGVPTFLMGGTLPAAARAVTNFDEVGRRSVGLLYGANTIGAVVGVCLSTFLLVEAFGTRMTLWLACAVNLANSGIAFWLSRHQKWMVTTSSSPVVQVDRVQVDRTVMNPTSTDGSVAAWLIYAAAGVTGFAFFLMEMVWYRMLAPLLGGSTFTFGLILAVALAGIGIGGAIYSRLFFNRKPTLAMFALTLAAEALALAFPLMLGDGLAVLTLSLRGMVVFGFHGLIASWFLITFIVVFPAALISGLQFPLMIGLLGRGDRNIGRELGQTFGWNTLGSMSGALAGGFGLLMVFTAPGVWRLVIVSLVIFSLLLMIYDLRKSTRMISCATFLFLAFSVLCAFQTGPTSLWRHGGIGAGRGETPSTRNDLIDHANRIRETTIWEADGLESTVAISNMDSYGFVVNGKTDGNAIGDAGTQIMLSVLPSILHPDSKSGLVVGLGTGESAGWMANLNFMDQVDVVELEPAVKKMAELCRDFNHNVLDHPKVALTFNDAREVLLTTRKQYDIIASEPSNPYRSGISSLYTEEFYEAAKQRLNPKGIFAQWLQGYEVSSDTVAVVLTTLSSVFEHVEIWQTQGSDLVLVCSAEPLEYDVASIAKKLTNSTVADATLAAWATQSADGVLSHIVASKQFVDAVVEVRALPPNTDDKNNLDYAFARTVGQSFDFRIANVLRQADQLGIRWPLNVRTQIDRQRIRDHEIASAVFKARAVPFEGTADSPRAKLWQTFQDGRIRDALLLWDEMGEQPRDFTEMLLLGLMYADVVDPRLESVLMEIEKICKADAEALRSIAIFQAGNTDQATLSLIQFFKRMRRDPFVSRPLLLRCLLIAPEVAAARGPNVGQLYATIRSTFSLAQANHQRATQAIAVASHLGPAETRDAMRQFEPYPIWTERMLQLRRDAYVVLNDPLASKAERDLALFLQHADTDLIP